MKTNFPLLILFAFLAFMCAACGHGKSSAAVSTVTYVRLVNATQLSDVKLTAVDSTNNPMSTANIPATGSSNYLSMTAGVVSVDVSSLSGTLAAPTVSSLSLSGGTYYTVVAYTHNNQIMLAALTDNQTAPATGFSSLAVRNVGADAGNLDIYLVTPGGSITGLTPTITDVADLGSSLTKLITAGTYDVVITAYNNPSDVRLSVSSVEFSSSSTYSLLFTGTSGGALVNGTLVQQGGAASVHLADKARVRIASAFATGGTADVRVSFGAPVAVQLPAVYTPSVGTYGLVPANSSAYYINVNGSQVASLPAVTFSSGGDYTILVYGSDPADPQVTVLSDNNQVPVSGANIRLINIAVSSPEGVSLTDNSVPVASTTLYGQSTGSFEVQAGTSVLQVQTPDSTFSSYSSTQSIANGVYSLFLLSTTSSSSQVIIRRDR